MKSPRRHILQLIALTALAFFANLGGPKLWDEDEPRNASCAYEMLERGDWVVPYFNGEVRDHKPVLLYWLMMASYAIFGVNEFAARFPSALLSVGTVLLTYSMGRRLFTDATALLAGIVLSTALMFVVAARAATPDATLIFLSTCALAIYVHAVWSPKKTSAIGGPPESRQETSPADWFPTSGRVAFAMYAIMGVAVLAKGPVGFLLPTAVIGMFLLIQWLPSRDTSVSRATTWRDVVARTLSPFHPLHFLRTCWRMKLGIAVLAVLAIALPWYIHVTLRSNGEWTRGFFLEHNFGRATRTMENHGGPPILYYIVALCCGLFPWSSFLGPWLIDLKNDWGDQRFRASRTFALCWIGVYVGLFSLASTKLPSYITPCYPALALLIGHFLERLSKGRVELHRAWLPASCLTLILVGAVISVGVPIAASQLLPGVEYLGAIGLVLLAGGTLAYLMFRKSEYERYVQLFVVTAVVFVTLTFGFAAAKVSDYRQINDLITKLKETSDRPKVAAFGAFRSSWVFYARQPVELFHHDAARTAHEFLNVSDDHYLIVPGSLAHLLGSEASYEVVSDVEWFLERDSLLLVKRATSTASHQVAVLAEVEAIKE